MPLHLADAVYLFVLAKSLDRVHLQKEWPFVH